MKFLSCIKKKKILKRAMNLGFMELKLAKFCGCHYYYYYYYYFT